MSILNSSVVLFQRGTSERLSWRLCPKASLSRHRRCASGHQPWHTDRFQPSARHASENFSIVCLLGSVRLTSRLRMSKDLARSPLRCSDRRRVLSVAIYLRIASPCFIHGVFQTCNLEPRAGFEPATLRGIVSALPLTRRMLSVARRIYQAEPPRHQIGARPIL